MPNYRLESLCMRGDVFLGLYRDLDADSGLLCGVELDPAPVGQVELHDLPAPASQLLGDHLVDVCLDNLSNQVRVVRADQAIRADLSACLLDEPLGSGARLAAASPTDVQADLLARVRDLSGPRFLLCPDAPRAFAHRAHVFDDCWVCATHPARRTSHRSSRRRSNRLLGQLSAPLPRAPRDRGLRRRLILSHKSRFSPYSDPRSSAASNEAGMTTLSCVISVLGF